MEGGRRAPRFLRLARSLGRTGQRWRLTSRAMAIIAFFAQAVTMGCCIRWVTGWALGIALLPSK
jgi:hypothetical protein